MSKKALIIIEQDPVLTEIRREMEAKKLLMIENEGKMAFWERTYARLREINLLPEDFDPKKDCMEVSDGVLYYEKGGNADHELVKLLKELKDKVSS